MTEAGGVNYTKHDVSQFFARVSIRQGDTDHAVGLVAHKDIEEDNRIFQVSIDPEYKDFMPTILSLRDKIFAGATYHTLEETLDVINKSPFVSEPEGLRMVDYLEGRLAQFRDVQHVITPMVYSLNHLTQ
jgi:hypothetical protein